MKKYQFEVCANSIESCLAAQAGGADRVELCAGIPEGGTTPSYGEISVARELLTTTRLHVIIRPRGGDFLYSPIEIKTMLMDIETAGKIGADGVVFGCLTAEGEIDLPAMQQLMQASKGLSVTFHRAFDVCRNSRKALEQIIELGCNRILTSHIARDTGIEEFHFSGRETIKSDMNYKNESVSMGGTIHINEYERNVTTAQRVTDTIQALCKSIDK